MVSWATHLPVLSIVSLLVFAYLMPLFSRWKKEWCLPATLLVLAFSFVSSMYLARRVLAQGPFIYHMGNWTPPWGIEFLVDYLGVFTALVITGVALLVFVYATSDLPHELLPGRIGWYCTLYLLLIGSMVGMALTNDLFNLFVWVEICAISSCAIISVKDSRECVEASFKYMVLSAVGSGCMLLSIALIYMITGHLNMSFIAAALPETMALYPKNLLAALALLMVGLGVKAALFPLHVWLPDAHASAPSPSSAVLSGLVIKIYAVAMIKILFRVFPAQFAGITPVLTMLLWLSTLAVIIGSMFAFVQEDIKKMLAYSSVAQIGYVFLGIGLANEGGLMGGILHIFNHAIMKSMLFLAAGAFIYSTGVRKISDLKGIGRTMPVPAIAFTIGAMAMVGIPATNGFISKWHLALGALDGGRPFYVAVILLSSLLNGLYYLPIVINAFFNEPQGKVMEPRPLPPAMSIPLVLLGSACIYFGLAPSGAAGLATKAARLVLGL